MENKLKNSLKNQMLKISLIPLLFLTLIIGGVSVSSLYKSQVNQVRAEMENDANLIVLLYDEVYDGEFSFSNDENGEDIIIYKGAQKITGDDTMLDALGEKLEIEISLFYHDTRIMTTLKNSNGLKAVGTKAAPLVKREALETGSEVFYNDVTVYDTKCFAYYKPLISTDGTVYGMIGVCRPADAVRSEVIANIWPIAVACIILAIIFSMIMVRYIKKVSARIERIDSFMNSLANGDFDVSMPREIMAQDDEIKRLATDGKIMAKAIKDLVEYDSLTGLTNRRFGEKKLNDIRNRADNTGEKYCVAIADIDYFKKVNDTYGHEIGDEVLKAVTVKLQEGMRGNGFAARWGGEEFLLAFSPMDLESATKVAEGIHESIRSVMIPKTDKNLTMSFGITEAKLHEKIDDTIRRADDYLYEAKGGGRDKIVSK